MKTCSVRDCQRKHYALGLCQMHWNRQRKHGDVFADRGPIKGVALGKPASCAAEGCQRSVRGGGRGWCRLHYGRWLRYGDVFADRPPLARVPLHLAAKPPPQRESSCSIDGCPEAAYVRGMCQRHYMRWLRKGDPNQKWSKPRQSEQVCSVDACDRVAYARGWCTLHLSRWQRHGDPEYVTRGLRGSGSLTKSGYRRIGQRYEHHRVMEAFLGRPLKRGEVVHHINGRRTDNRIDNLQLRVKATHPPGQAVEDVYRWCLDFVKEYRGTVQRLAARDQEAHPQLALRL